MPETFIIDDHKVELDVLEKTFTAVLIDVTTFSDNWKNYIHSGLTFLKLLVNHVDVGEITETYQIIGEAQGILMLKSIEDD